MSAQTIARWNAIPMSRTEQNLEEHSESDRNSKRSKPPEDDEEDDSDDMSLVSRTPSPRPLDVESSLSKYDEYARGAPREVITVDTKIKSTNKGFAILAKLGWVEGQPVGLSGDGRVDPIPFHIKQDLTGVGKINQDVRMIETTVSQRRELDSEKQHKETEDQRRQREDTVARRAAVQLEISSVLRPFYCELCDKQFKNVAQYDEHTNSYAHHHKARFKDMQASQRIPKEEADKRKEKERKREEKELRKLAKAAGIKMARPPTAPTPATAATSSASVDSVVPEAESKSSGFKKDGWATVTPTSDPPRSRPGSSGWASIDSASSPAPPPTAVPPSPPPPSSSNPSSSSQYNMSSAPAFRTGGWTSLDTGSSLGAPPAPPPASPPPPPAPASPPMMAHPPPASSLPPPPPAQTPQALPRRGWAPVPSMPPPPPPAESPSILPNSPSVNSTHAIQSSAPRLAPPPRPSLGAPVPPTASPVRQESSGKMGWQQWKQSGPKRK